MYPLALSVNSSDRLSPQRGRRMTPAKMLSWLFLLNCCPYQAHQYRADSARRCAEGQPECAHWQSTFTATTQNEGITIRIEEDHYDRWNFNSQRHHRF